MRNILALQTVSQERAGACRFIEDGCVSSYSVVSCVSNVSSVGQVA